MVIKARIAVVVDSETIVDEGEVEVKEGADLKKFFKLADKAMGYSKTRYFKRALKSKVPPTVLLNGDRLDLPEGMKHKLVHEDEVTVLTPMAGG